MFTADGGGRGSTLERRKALRRELVDPKIAEHHGRIVKTTGDDLLVEFPSVVDTVRCAVEMQHAIAERNTGVAADDRTDRVLQALDLLCRAIERDPLYGPALASAAHCHAMLDLNGWTTTGR